MKRSAKIVLTFTVGLIAMAFSSVAFAQDANATVQAAKYASDAWIALAASLGITLAAIGGALGQSRAASTALEGIARNPGAADKLFTPMILGLALIESLVIYALIIAFLLVNKIG